MATPTTGSNAGSKHEYRLTLDQVSVERGGQCVLGEVSTTIEPGAVTAVVGANGAGKSTLLRAMAGLVPTARGIVRVGPEAVSALSPAARARCLALVPQETQLSVAMPVAAVVAMGRYAHGGGRPDHPTVVAAMARTDCQHLASRPFTQLSTGERRRVLMARALATEAAVLLVDEPTANLDLAHARRVMVDLRVLAQAGHSVVVALHDLGEVSLVADRVLVLHDQRVLAAGTPAEVLTPALIRTVFGVVVEPGAADGYRLPTGGA